MKVCMLFPGYGNQFVGMGKEFYDESRTMQEFFEEASVCLPINFVKLCFASSEIELAKPMHAYPALFLMSVSIAKILEGANIVPEIVAGYDIGQYASLYTAGGISFPDGLYLLSKYAILYQELLASAEFAALQIHGIPTSLVDKICAAHATENQYVHSASYESADTCIIAGHASAVEMVRTAVRSEGATVKSVPVETGLHSFLMHPVTEGLKMYLEKVDIRDTAIPLLIGNNHGAIKTAAALRDHLIYSIEVPFHWDTIIASLKEYDLILVIGPGTSLYEQVREAYPEKQIITINKPTDIVQVQEIISSIQPME